MTQEFRKTHMIQAALQQKGAPMGFIQDFLSKLKAAARSPNEFEQWNHILDHEDVKLLTVMLSPGGKQYCDVLQDSLFSTLTNEFNLSTDDLQLLSEFN